MPKHFGSSMRFIPVNKDSITLADDFKEGKKYDMLLEIIPEVEDDFFREVFVEYKGRRQKAKFYISKTRKNSSIDGSEQGPREGSLSPKPNNA